MKPTNKLRFVRRTETHTPVGGNPIEREVTILQQWVQDTVWERIVRIVKGELKTAGVWRDVPLEQDSGDDKAN